MLRNYLLVALRNLVKHKLYSFINIGGLAVGLAACLLILLFVRDEMSFESWVPNSERIAIVETEIEAAMRAANVTGPVTCVELIAAEGFKGVEGSPCWADVSVDLFRLPEAPRPDKISEVEWLARCEAVFLHSRITGVAATSTAAGDLFTRILGHRVRMRYRPEMSAVQRLWRVELV